MDNWIDDLAAKSRLTMSAMSNADERFNTEQRLKTILGEKFWQDLLATLQESAKLHNEKVGAEILGVARHGPCEVEVYAQFSEHRRRHVPVSYAPDGRVIAWGHPEVITSTHLYLLELVGDTHMVAVVSMGDQVKRPPKEIAKEILAFVIDYR